VLVSHTYREENGEEVVRIIPAMKEEHLCFFRKFQMATAAQPARIGRSGTPFTLKMIATDNAAVRKYRHFTSTPPQDRAPQKSQPESVRERQETAPWTASRYPPA